MDAWLQEGLRFLMGLRIEAIDQVFHAAGPSCFLLRGLNGSGTLAGSIRPSRDLSGRKYPFFVAAEADPVSVSGMSAQDVPFSLERLFSVSSSLVDDAVDGRLDTGSLDEQLAAHGNRIEPEQRGWQGAAAGKPDVTFGTLCAAIWGSFRDTRKYAAFRNLLDVLVPVRAGGRAIPGYGLQFPLADGELLPLSVGFWLDVCSRLSGDSARNPSVIWNVRSTTSGVKPSLYVIYNRAPASAILQILQHPMDLDNLFRVDSPGAGSAAEMVLSIPERVGRLIETEEMPLHGFAQTLEAACLD